MSHFPPEKHPGNYGKNLSIMLMPSLASNQLLCAGPTDRVLDEFRAGAEA